MEIVKMFDKDEIKKETGINILDIYWGSFCNDVSIPWWVDEHEDEDYEKIDNYLLAHGADPGEKVWIDVTW